MAIGRAVVYNAQPIHLVQELNVVTVTITLDLTMHVANHLSLSPEEGILVAGCTCEISRDLMNGVMIPEGEAG